MGAMRAFLKDGESIRFTGDEGLLEPVQRAVAQSQSVVQTQPKAAPRGTQSAASISPIKSVVDAECYRVYDQRLEEAWRNGEKDEQQQ